MSAVDKVLKKVEQDRSKGNDEKALQRLKEALAREPRQYPLAREAADICFQTGRSIEGVSILRTAMKRCPSDRADALALAREEFQRGRQLEIGELLYDACLAKPDFAEARDVVEYLAEPDRENLLHKLQSKLKALREDAPEERRRLAGLFMAQGVALSAMQRSVDAAACFDRVLDADPNATETIGRLSKEELQRNGRCAPVSTVLGRCYLGIGEYERAAEQFLNVSADAVCRSRVLHLLQEVPKQRALQEVRAYMLLLEKHFDAAQEALEELLNQSPGSDDVVRRILESVPDAAHATAGLRRLLARVLAGTEASERAVRELEHNREQGGSTTSDLAVVDEILKKNPSDADALQLRARLHLGLGNWSEAANDFQRMLELEPMRSSTLKVELEGAWEPSAERAAIGALLVRVLFQSEAPREAAALLAAVRQTGGSTAAVLFELSALIAGSYGFSSELLAVFVEAALELDREADARAAIQHYYASPDARAEEFSRRMEAILTKRPALGESLARAFQGIELPASMRMLLLHCRLAGDNHAAALADLATLVAQNPEVRAASLDILERFLQRRGEVRPALELVAQLHLDAGQLTEAAHYFARAVDADPGTADRVCRLADPLFTQGATFDEVWRPVLLALVDNNCFRTARDLCYRAAQAVPLERQGFLHAALGACHLDAGHVAAATEAFENALQCEDAPLDRVLAGLRQALELDAQHGHTHYVLARAILLSGDNPGAAIDELQEAVRLDQMLAELALDTLSEYGDALQKDGNAIAFEGVLRLRKGEKQHGVELLDRALRVSPEVSPTVLKNLQLEWDRDGESIVTGIALSRALVSCDQHRRAIRLLADMARRFEHEHPRIVTELEQLTKDGTFPEAHRALWEIRIRNGDRDAALKQVQLAVEKGEHDVEVQRELLEAAHQKLGDEAWIACRLAQLEIDSRNDERAERLLRELLEQDLNAHEQVLAALGTAAGELSEPLALLEIDAQLASKAWEKAHAGLRHFRARYPDGASEALKRLRLLVKRGNTELRAELDLALLMQEKGEIEDAVRILEEALRIPEATDAGAGNADGEFDATFDALWQESESTTLTPAAPAGENALDTPPKSTLDTSPHATEARLLLASLYVDLGRVGEGKALLEAVLESDASNEKAYDFLKNISSQTLRNKLRQLQDSIDRTPGDLRARLELGRLCLLSRDFQGAREALGFPTDSPALEATRRYLLARTYADEERPHLAAAVLRGIDLSEVSEPELRRNILYLQARSAELLGRFAEAHATYLRIVSEYPDFKDAHEKSRSTYRRHLETTLETRALTLEKRTGIDLD